VVTYGLRDADRTTDALELGPFGARFVTTYAGRPEPFTLASAGAHNVENALAALVVAESAGVSAAAARDALASFAGVARRQTVRGIEAGVRVIDDFAHHPTAVARTLRGLAAQYPEGRLFAVFEPRTATSARRIFRDAYAEAFDVADDVTIAPIGRPDLPEHERLDTKDLARAIAARGPVARAASSLDAIVDDLAGRAGPGDTIAFMSNGGFGDIHEKTLAALKARGS
jgi:UDP-N-acetylmuramate: L-alanyl-gamma-D-glutamyl-meso-diaminopimelate ligase